MTDATDELDPAPTPTIDPPEPPHPDELDTVSPGLTDESGTLPAHEADGDQDTDPTDAAEAGDDTTGDGGTPPQVATAEPTA
jgi:hypothetical protein